MLDVKVKIVDSSGQSITPAQLRKRMRTFVKTIHDLPERVAQKFPRTFQATINNKVRGFWKENYLSKQAWQATSHSELGARIKDSQYFRGDTFKLAPLGKFEMAGNSMTFGLRTGNLMNAIGSPVGTSITTRISKKDQSGERSFFYGILIGINESVFNGDNNMRYIEGDTDRAVPVSRPGREGNYLYHFSRLITQGSPDTTSVLVRLSQNQLQNISDFIMENWRIRVRDTVQLAALKPLTGK